MPAKPPALRLAEKVLELNDALAAAEAAENSEAHDVWLKGESWSAMVELAEKVKAKKPRRSR